LKQDEMSIALQLALAALALINYLTLPAQTPAARIVGSIAVVAFGVMLPFALALNPAVWCVPVAVVGLAFRALVERLVARREAAGDS
jgi:hypothetical protein